MSDFWTQFDKPYRFFSQFCDSDDWHTILAAVAGAVTETAMPNVGMSILDVGCGTGVATETICEMIFSKTKNFPQVTVVEPSKIARDRVEANLLGHHEGGVLKASHKALCELESGVKFDSIMFLHSTYYVSDFTGTLKKLVRNHLYPGGTIVALVLSEDSSFFLQLGALPNCLNSLSHDFRKVGLHGIREHQLQSRFHLPKNWSLSEKEWKSLCTFFRPEGIGVEEFKRRITQELSKDHYLDFQDYLLIAKSPIT